MVLAGIDDETAWHGMDGIGIGIGSWLGMGEQGGGVIFSRGFVFVVALVGFLGPSLDG